MNKTKKHLAISFATQYSELVIQFCGVLVLARVLSPAETGTYSVAAFLMTLLHVFRDFGIARYVIQTQNLPPEKIRSAFGVAIILAWIVAFILLVSSGLIAGLYQTPAIKDILVIMSASFAITPLGSLPIAVFRREMQLWKVLITRISSALCQVAVAISMALWGCGAISLAWGNFAGILAFGIVAFSMRPRTIKWTPHFTSIGGILSFGGISSVGSLANVAGTNASDVIIGKVASLASAGYFSRANGLVQLFKTLVVGAIMPLILPHFAQIRREKGDQKDPYYSAIEHLTAFSWPFFSVMALLALPVVRTLYGGQWDFSVTIVQLLCIAGVVSSVGIFAGEVMVANGNVRESSFVQVITCAVKVLAILLASRHGLPAVAFAIIVAECISLTIVSYCLHRTIGISFMTVLGRTRKSIVITGWTSVLPFLILISGASRTESSWIPALSGGMGAFCGWLIGIVLTGHPIKLHVYQMCDRVIQVLARTTVAKQFWSLLADSKENRH